MKNSSLGTKLLMAVVTLAVLAYFGIQVLRYFGDPLTTTVAYRYPVEESVALSGYVVRGEQVLSDSAGGLLRLQRAEGERVSAGGVVATVYADQASLDRQNEIDTLETRVSQLQYAEEAALGSEASLKLDAQILRCLLEYREDLTADRLDNAEGHGSELRALVLKRDYTYSESGDLPAEIAALQAELKTLRSQAAGSVRRITAPAAGLYSAVVDGYEGVLTPASLPELTPSQLAKVQPAEPPAAVGKLILGDAWYYAAVMDAEAAEQLQEDQAENGGTMALRFSKTIERDLPVTLTSVSPEEGGRVVAVFQGRTHLPQLTLLRQQSADVIYDTLSGIRVPKEALRVTRTTVDEEGNRTVTEETGIYCIVGLEARFKPVDVLYSGDGFLLVRAADGVDEKTRLRPGDTVIITALDLYDGKIIK